MGLVFEEMENLRMRALLPLCAGSGENLPDIAKSRDASMDNRKFCSLLHILIKQNSFLF